MTKDLNGIHVLITRPRPQGVELAKLIQDRGGEAFVWPCLDIAPSPNLKNIKTAVARSGPEAIFIFVSPNAVLYGFAALSPAEKERLRHSLLIAIGEGTAKALKEQGCRNVIFPNRADSEGLLDLPVLQNVAGKKILIFRAQSGRELIAKTLLEKKAALEYVEVYLRQKPQTDPRELIEAWQNKAFDIVVVTSTESLRNLIDMLGERADLLKNTPLTVINEKMLHLATQMEARQLWIDAASNSAVLNYLKRFLHERL